VRVVNKLSCVMSAPRIAVVPSALVPSDINALDPVRMTKPRGEFQQTVSSAFAALLMEARPVRALQ
ncbi:MAG: hypothetical protein ACK5TK_15405, partial [Betaproteobacteria bacterium]